MKYELVGKITLSKDVSGKEKEIGNFLKTAEAEILKTIKNQEELKYTSSFTIDGKIITVTVTTLKTSSAMIFYRIRKSLAEQLGKSLRIGVKDLKIDKLIVSFPIEKLPLDDFTVPFVEKITIDKKKNNCTFELRDVDKDFITKNYIERIVRLIKEKIDRFYYEGKSEYHNILYSSEKKEIFSDADPTEEMKKLNWIMPASTKGKWVYWSPAVAIFNAMKKIIHEYLLEPLGFEEMINSNIVSGEDIWLKTGHLEGMPMEIYYVAEPKTRDVKEWENFVDLLKITKQIPYDEFAKMIQINPLKGLAYAQCPPIYWAFKNKTIASESFPILLYEATSNSFRYESGGRHGIERVDEFHRIEVVYIGTPETLLELRKKLIDKYTYIFNNILDIEWRMAQVTPFYMQQAGKIFEEGVNEGALGTIDFEAWLPYRGSRDESEWLEFQNLSIVGEKYIKAFNIKNNKNEDLWSGCTGIGLERWVSVFLAQKGLDPEKWPDAFKKYVPNIPKPFVFY